MISFVLVARQAPLVNNFMKLMQQTPCLLLFATQTHGLKFCYSSTNALSLQENSTLSTANLCVKIEVRLRPTSVE